MLILTDYLMAMTPFKRYYFNILQYMLPSCRPARSEDASHLADESESLFCLLILRGC